MKKFFAPVVLGMLIVIFSGSQSYATQVKIKNNSQCTIANLQTVYQKYTYKCVKNKNKLIWKKIQLAPIQTITKASIETVTITAKVEIKSIGQKASENFLSWASKNRSVKTNHFVHKNYDIPEDIFLSINKTEIEAKDIFANFVKQDTYSFYGGEDKDWFYAHNKFIPPGNTSNICGIHSDSLAACVNLIDSTFFRLPHDNFKPSNAASVLGAHEYFHFVQMSLANLTPFVQRNIPRWLEEGSAEFVGYSILSNIESKTYDSLISSDRKVFIDIESDPYISGRIFTEFIISEYGFDSILKMFSEYNNIKSFEIIFKNIIGITIEEAMYNYKKAKNG